ncbi:acetyl-CoA acetyltransferase [Pontibacillus halophilus JSM 076056 = DSM 19796]|uniref:acetyl-CoA C-acetyltransferase n=1 Tax=Pontibacillus halophilus JSM 076056 = DSM 19796 TaxID=1385510 RepID=A0A0A5GKP1_9BACI|nr:acetyl-CoA C-acetyltransferase [Pontibacillus halophilus]KGX93856.1 acetyl-CoA acetyltransferase [Pontibacillus halophilus JSM 076056 = DSM 19796]
MNQTVIVGGARTPFGKFGGALSSLTAMELGGYAIKESLKRTGIQGEDVDEVIMGMVLQGGQGQIPSRQAARLAGIPWDVKTETINKVCASGLRSVTLGDQLIRLGDEQVVVAGGMESMSNAPYFLPNARFGFRMGDGQVKDMMVHDGLTCSFHAVHMGNYGNRTAEEYGLSREAQDEWAYRSHQRAIEATKNGTLGEEIVDVEVPQRKGEALLVSKDEAPREDTSLERLQKLRPAFDKDGSITAGNAPGVNDGAGAMVLTSEAYATSQGLQPLAYIKGHAEVAVQAEDFPKTPGLVINKLVEKTGVSLQDIDLFEVNEAFAAVALASGKIAELDPDKINVNGGAVALGHPIGASGARIVLTLMYELIRRGGGKGIAAICSGGGQGDAVLIEVPKG